MRILDVSPRPVHPPRRGSTVRMHNLLRELSVRHEVRQFSQERAAFALRPSLSELRVGASYREQRWSHPLAWLAVEAGRRACLGAPVLAGAGLRLGRPASLRRLIAWADVVLVEFPWQFEHCRRLRPGGPLVLSCHNVESLKFGSWGEAAGSRRSGERLIRYVRRAEANAVTRADLVLTVSAADRRELIGRYGADPGRVVEVPNGAVTSRHAPADGAVRAAAKRELGLPDTPTVVFAASDIAPNQRGLEWIRRLAAGSNGFTFLVVGGVSPTAGTHGSLVTTGPVERVDPYLRAADFAICPIEHGGGTKIKLLESLAAGLPTVAFEDALHGTEVRDGIHALVAGKSEAALRSALDRLAADPQLARDLAGAGRRLAADRYDWARIAERLERELVRLASAR